MPRNVKRKPIPKAKLQDVKEQSDKADMQKHIQELEKKIEQLEEKVKSLQNLCSPQASCSSSGQKRGRGSCSSIQGTPSPKKRKEQWVESGNTWYFVHIRTSRKVKIEEVDPEGKFVRLKNLSNEDQLLGNWQIKRQNGEQKPIIYRFPPRVVLKAGQTLTVWAAGAGVTHNPPTEFIMTSPDSWGTGVSMRTALLTSSNEEVAMYKLDEKKDEQ